MKFALVLHRDADGIVTGHHAVGYKNFVKDVKAKGHKAEHHGFESAEAARIAGNLLAGTDGTQAKQEPETDEQ